jgi:hypothetical protein
MTHSGESNSRAAEIERGLLAVLRDQRSATIHYLWNHIRPPATHLEIQAAAERLIAAGLAKQSRAGSRPMDQCWDITPLGAHQ